MVDEENQAFGTYAGGGKKGEMITYRVHTKSVWGGYRIVTKVNSHPVLFVFPGCLLVSCYAVAFCVFEMLDLV